VEKVTNERVNNFSYINRYVLSYIEKKKFSTSARVSSKSDYTESRKMME